MGKELPRRVEWRQLQEGALVWAPVGTYGWRAAIVVGFGRSRDQRTIIKLAFDASDRRTSPGQGHREVRHLAWRKVGEKRPLAPDNAWYHPECTLCISGADHHFLRAR